MDRRFCTKGTAPSPSAPFLNSRYLFLSSPIPLSKLQLFKENNQYLLLSLCSSISRLPLFKENNQFLLLSPQPPPGASARCGGCLATSTPTPPGPWTQGSSTSCSTTTTSAASAPSWTAATWTGEGSFFFCLSSSSIRFLDS